jgi:hypothetical protein
MFWTHLFELAEVDAHIEDVGGNEEIAKKIKEILDNNASFIVACDSDHSDFTKPITHDRVIKTYGYSIENFGGGCRFGFSWSMSPFAPRMSVSSRIKTSARHASLEGARH